MAAEHGKPGRKSVRPPLNLIDKAQVALQQLIDEKGAKRASGRFGVVVVLDAGRHTGIRAVTDEALHVA